MKYLKHAFEWGYGYGMLALLGALAYMPFIPVAYAGNYMTATMLVNMSESGDVAQRAMAAGYVAAIHDELAGKSLHDLRCFAVPQSVGMNEMANRTIHFVDWFAHDLRGWPKDKDFMYPAKELVHLGLIENFPCEQI
ncbi:hypothetical protein N9K52_02390 [Litoricolaceae bacterium]|nr:hypothetical protein [Litorivicinaceae bacterium]